MRRGGKQVSQTIKVGQGRAGERGREKRTDPQAIKLPLLFSFFSSFSFSLAWVYFISVYLFFPQSFAHHCVIFILTTLLISLASILSSIIILLAGQFLHHHFSLPFLLPLLLRLLPFLPHLLFHRLPPALFSSLLCSWRRVSLKSKSSTRM